MGRLGLGFGAEIQKKEERRLGQILKDTEPEDLTKYGLIPEFIGRLPVIATLDDLGRDDLKRILTEPKNALIRQYQKLFALERVELVFDDEAILAVADQAIASNSGARGLRTILETAKLDIMYEVPCLEGSTQWRITAGGIAREAQPELVFEAKKSA